MITLRFADISDAAALLEIYRPYVEHTAITFETKVPSLEEFSERIRSISAFYPYIVAEEDRKIIGYAYCHQFRERAAYDWTAETTIYMAEDARRNGAGTVLYTALIRLMREMKLHLAVAVITIPNDPSIAFHEKLGFRNAGVITEAGFKQGAWYGIGNLSLILNEANENPERPVSVHALPVETVEKIFRGEAC